MVPEAMRNHFAGTKVLRNTLQVSNQARESYIERSLTRISPKCLLEVKAEKDFGICILDFWNCIFQDFSPILYRPKDLLVCLPGCPWFINSSNIFAWLVFFETVQICKNKGDAAGVFEGKFFTDNLIAWQQLKRWLVLSWNYLLVGFRRLCQLLYRNPCFLWFQCWLETRHSVWICLNLVPKLDPKLVPKKDSKRGQNGSFNSGFLFGPNSGPNLGSNSGPNFGPNSGSDFGPNSGPTLAPNQILFVAFDCAVGQELQKKPGQAQRWFQKRWETILRGQRCFETPCRYPIRHARVTLREAEQESPQNASLKWKLRKISTFAFWTFEIASSKTFHRYCIAQRTCWSACRAVLDLLIQVTSLLGWCSLKRFKSARTRETQPGCLKESFSQIIW